MCDVCDREMPLIERIKPFLKEGVTISLKPKAQGDEWQNLILQDESRTITITADGDEGGYFHHRDGAPESGQSVTRTFEITRRSYSIEIEEDLFVHLLDSESHVTNGAAYEPGAFSLDEKLNALPGVCDVQYGGHFGAGIAMSIDVDADTDDLKSRISTIVDNHLAWCASLPKDPRFS